MSESFFDLLKNGDLRIFPPEPDDIKIACSCRQQEVCPHISVVFRSLEKKIDKNPSLILSLRGLSIEELTEATGLKSYYINKLNKSIHNNFIPYCHSERSEESKNDLQFAFSKADVNSLFFILPNDPLFFERKDFKSKLISLYETVDTELDSILVIEKLAPLRETEFYLYYTEDNRLKAFFTPVNSFLSYLKSKGSRVRFSSKTLKIPLIGEKEGMSIPADMVFDYFLFDSLNDNNDEVTPSCRFLRSTASLALALARSLCFIPEVVMDNNEEFSIRYVPMLNNNKISEVIAQYSSIMPINFLFKDKGNKILPKDAAVDFLSLFLSHIIHKVTFLKASKFQNDTVTNIFTKTNPVSAVTPEGKNIALSIAHWLDVISRKEEDIKPIIRVEKLKNEDNFALYVDVDDYKNPALISQLIIASNYMPVLADILDSKGAYIPKFDLKEIMEFISHTSIFLNALDIRIMIPKELNNIISPRISLKVGLKKRKGFDISAIFDKSENSYLSINKLLEFSYEIAIGDEKISREEFLELVKSADGIVKYKDQYVLLKPEDISSLLEKLNNPAPEAIDSMTLLQSTFSGFYDGMDFDVDESFKKAVDNFLKVDEITIPQDLTGVLRPYQERGFKWLYSNTVRGFGSCMADDMGLGKTIQVISLLLKIKEEGNLVKPALVICPTTLVGNWYKECAKFAPSLNVVIYHGSDRSLELSGADIIITTYGLLRNDLETFKDIDWDFVIIDEAQNIKNPDAGQTLAVKSLKTKISIAMTGTPVENRLTELWSIFDYTNKGYLGNLRGFQQNYANIIEKHRDEQRIKQLRLATAPFTLRRLKNDKSIISDLPEKIIFDEYCYLTKEQAALYEKVLETSFKEMDGKTGISRKGHIFKLITQLKQVCNHPTQYSKMGQITKEMSGKAEKTMSIIEQIREQGEKTIIFTQYKEMGDLLVRMIQDEFKIDVPFFHGSVTRIKRDEMVEAFQTNDDIKLMVISLKAGGTGLNLTAATNVIHYDLWWNPAVEDQATDRTYRIGQTHNVIVYRLISLGTFEEKIDEMIKSKKELANLTVSTGENWITEMSNKDLREIFTLHQRY
ncbi:MAG: hypothetical protein A2Y25_11570 [Candidatus Melainabacteria bacterium GWF2_37_15]|nr:MAG: hypothetical protein A2Y25_11570 [Candidatus Melainabacteria bacterium GWF2_37_15]